MTSPVPFTRDTYRKTCRKINGKKSEVTDMTTRQVNLDMYYKLPCLPSILKEKQAFPFLYYGIYCQII